MPHVSLWTILLLAISTCIDAQEIVTDRPDQTESSTTIPKKSFQIEMGFGSGNYNNERLTLLPTALLRYGLIDQLELRLVEQLAGYTNKNVSGMNFGLTDIEFGIKLQMLKKETINTEIAFISHMVIPTGSPELTNTTVGTINKLAVSHVLNTFTDLGYNLGYNYFGSGNGDLTFSAVFGFGLSEKLGTYVEFFGEYSDLRDITANIDSGITYLLQDNLQLDFSLGLGLNRKMNYFSFGFSWNNKGHQHKID
jgi:hypothetical protein